MSGEQDRCVAVFRCRACGGMVRFEARGTSAFMLSEGFCAFDVVRYEDERRARHTIYSRATHDCAGGATGIADFVCAEPLP